MRMGRIVKQGLSITTCQATRMVIQVFLRQCESRDSPVLVFQKTRASKYVRFDLFPMHPNPFLTDSFARVTVGNVPCPYHGMSVSGCELRLLVRV